MSASDEHDANECEPDSRVEGEDRGDEERLEPELRPSRDAGVVVRLAVREEERLGRRRLGVEAGSEEELQQVEQPERNSVS